MNKFSKRKAYDFTVCSFMNIMGFHRDFERTTQHCLVDSNDHKLAIECSKGDEGNKFQHEFAIKSPKEHTYVPWVIVNGVHDLDAEKKITDNLMKLC